VSLSLSRFFRCLGPASHPRPRNERSGLSQCKKRLPTLRIVRRTDAVGGLNRRTSSPNGDRGVSDGPLQRRSPHDEPPLAWLRHTTCGHVELRSPPSSRPRVMELSGLERPPPAATARSSSDDIHGPKTSPTPQIFFFFPPRGGTQRPVPIPAGSATTPAKGNGHHHSR